MCAHPQALKLECETGGSGQLVSRSIQDDIDNVPGAERSALSRRCPLARRARACGTATWKVQKQRMVGGRSWTWLIDAKAHRVSRRVCGSGCASQFCKCTDVYRTAPGACTPPRKRDDVTMRKPYLAAGVPTVSGDRSRDSSLV